MVDFGIPFDSEDSSLNLHCSIVKGSHYTITLNKLCTVYRGLGVLLLYLRVKYQQLKIIISKQNSRQK